jgi:hypothetical protein
MARVKTTEPWIMTASKREGIMPSDAAIRQQGVAQLALQEPSLKWGVRGSSIRI